MKYSPQIDGLRSLAVLGVLFYHFKLLGIKGGFLGVDVFFVISGYLIAGAMFREIAETGRLSFSAFWLRRMRRILPALFAMLAASMAAGWFLLSGTSLFAGYAKSLLAALFSVSNFLFFFESGYFDTASINKPLLHTWSLGVEEQFYLVFPFIVWFLLVRLKAGRRFFLAALCLFLSASLAACLYFAESAQSFAFFMLPTRLWELLAGALLAFALPKNSFRPARFSLLFEAAALGGLLAALFLASKGIGWWNVLAVGCAAGLVALRNGPLLSRVLGCKPLVWTGKISYSLYLWHWPIVVFMSLYFIRLRESVRWQMLPPLFLLAWLSCKYIEQPFRKQQVGYRTLARRLGPVMTGVAALSLLFLFANPVNPVLRDCAIPLPNPLREAKDIEQDKLCYFGQAKGPEDAPKLDFLLIGDSHAASSRSIVIELAEKHGLYGSIITSLGMFFNPDYQSKLIAEKDLDIVHAMHGFIQRNNVKNILIVESWSSYHPKWKSNDWAVLWKGQDLSAEKMTEAYRQALKESFGKWLADGRNVYLLEQVPEHHYESMERAALVFQSAYLDDDAEKRQFLRDMVAEINHPNLHLLPTDEIFKRDGKFIFVRDGQLLYVDHNHISDAGAKLLEPALEPFFASLKQKRSAP